PVGVCLGDRHKFIGLGMRNFIFYILDPATGKGKGVECSGRMEDCSTHAVHFVLQANRSVIFFSFVQIE
ncbi:MAG: hypothetical protein AAB728_02830, partial [Patescibacteria group bacterium]